MKNLTAPAGKKKRDSSERLAVQMRRLHDVQCVSFVFRESELCLSF